MLVIDDILNVSQLESEEFRVCSKWVNPIEAIINPTWRMVTLNQRFQDKLELLTLKKTVDENIPPSLFLDGAHAAKQCWREISV